MRNLEQRRTAMGTFVGVDRSYAHATAELGYPTRSFQRNRWKEREEAGDVPVGKGDGMRDARDVREIHAPAPRIAANARFGSRIGRDSWQAVAHWARFLPGGRALGAILGIFPRNRRPTG